MDKKAISRIKKALTKNNCAVDKVRGCFVDEHGNIVAQLTEPFLAMPEEDADKYCEIFRKTLSGKPGKTLYSMEFPLAEETDGGKQVQLYRLLRSDFTSEEQLDTFFRRIIDHLEFDGKYLITLAHGVYDLPGVARDGSEMDDASELVYQFLLCSICPVKEIKEGLYFDAASMNFIAKHDALGVQAPKSDSCFLRLPTIRRIFTRHCILRGMRITGIRNSWMRCWAATCRCPGRIRIRFLPKSLSRRLDATAILKR